MRPLYWLIVALGVTLTAAGLMTFHTVRHIVNIHRANAPLRPWMTIPYIARTRHVPRGVLFEAVGLPPDQRDYRPIRRIARQQGRPVEELLRRLQSAIEQARGHDPPAAGRGVP